MYMLALKKSKFAIVRHMNIMVVTPSPQCRLVLLNFFCDIEAVDHLFGLRRGVGPLLKIKQ